MLAIKIYKEHSDKILRGEKTAELRLAPCKIGTKFLMNIGADGTFHAVGTFKVTGVRKLTVGRLKRNFDSYNKKLQTNRNFLYKYTEGLSSITPIYIWEIDCVKRGLA